MKNFFWLSRSSGRDESGDSWLRKRQKKQRWILPYLSIPHEHKGQIHRYLVVPSNRKQSGCPETEKSTVQARLQAPVENDCGLPEHSNLTLETIALMRQQEKEWS
jgi:hypothetical protein